MALTTSALSGDFSDALAATSAALSNSLRVALPGIIESFDPETVTCIVAPAIKGVITASDGSTRSVSYPLLVDVPVVFPRGGGCTLTFPIKNGDECLVIFADRAIDFWWQNGETQEPVNARQHSLSDAFVIPGPQSQVKKISGISTRATQLRTDDGAAFIEVAQGHDITLKTPGKIRAEASGVIEFVAPAIELTGDVKINGNLTASGDVKGAGIRLASHIHGGVSSGGSSTGKPT